MMKNKKRRFIEIFLISVVFTLWSCSFISALGFSYGYGPENHLEVYPGQTKDVQISLQTSLTEEIETQAILTDDGDIAKIDEDARYFISSGNDAPVIITIKMPNDAVIGEEKIVKVRFLEVDLGYLL